MFRVFGQGYSLGGPTLPKQERIVPVHVRPGAVPAAKPSREKVLKETIKSQKEAIATLKAQKEGFFVQIQDLHRDLIAKDYETAKLQESVSIVYNVFTYNIECLQKQLSAQIEETERLQKDTAAQIEETENFKRLLDTAEHRRKLETDILKDQKVELHNRVGYLEGKVRSLKNINTALAKKRATRAGSTPTAPLPPAPAVSSPDVAQLITPHFPEPASSQTLTEPEFPDPPDFPVVDPVTRATAHPAPAILSSSDVGPIIRDLPEAKSSHPVPEIAHPKRPSSPVSSETTDARDALPGSAICVVPASAITGVYKELDPGFSNAISAPASNPRRVFSPRALGARTWAPMSVFMDDVGNVPYTGVSSVCSARVEKSSGCTSIGGPGIPRKVLRVKSSAELNTVGKSGIRKAQNVVGNDRKLDKGKGKLIFAEPESDGGWEPHDWLLFQDPGPSNRADPRLPHARSPGHDLGHNFGHSVGHNVDRDLPLF